MKKLLILCICFFSGIVLFAQTNFRELTLQQALDQAKSEGKMVFVDCYTSWCGPCKYMADKVFPQQELGDYLNNRFVCLKINAEQGEGVDIAKRYAVAAYPTFLILKTDGELIYKIVGGCENADEFIGKVEAGFGDESAYKMEERYSNGERDYKFLFKYVYSLLESGLDNKACEVTGEWLATLSDKEKCSKKFWFIYDNFRLSPIGSENMNYFHSHLGEFRKSVGDEIVNAKLTTLYENQLENMLRGQQTSTDKELDVVEKKMCDDGVTAKHLFGYIEMMRALNKKDADRVLDLYDDVYSDMPESKLSYLYFRPAILLRSQWNDEQKAQLISFTNELIKRMETQVMQLSLTYFAEAIPTLERAYAGMKGQEKSGPKLEKVDSLKVGDICPKFEFQDTTGHTVTLQHFKGKYVIIDIWASWCYPCKKEYPTLKALAEKYKDKDVVFVSISCDSEKQRWVNELFWGKMTGEQWWIADDSKFMKAFRITRIPRLILLDKEGKVLNLNLPKPSAEEFEEIVNSLW